MKIISSFMDEINLKRGGYHTITFESSYLQQMFRKLISTYYSNQFSDQRSNCNFLDLVNADNGETFKRKDIAVLNFNCNIIDLTIEKTTSNLLYDQLFFLLENNHHFLNEFNKLNESVEKFINAIAINSGNLKIEFESTKKTIQSLIKTLNIYFEYENNKYVPNYILREFLIKSLLMLNENKEVLLIIAYPETDIGREDFQNAIESIKKLNITTLVITSEHDFVVSAEPELISLVDKNGRIYDIHGLINEMRVFGLKSNNELYSVAKSAAFYDFTGNTGLLSKELKEFLSSNKI